jgi:hypothetical protein
MLLSHYGIVIVCREREREKYIYGYLIDIIGDHLQSDAKSIKWPTDEQAIGTST